MAQSGDEFVDASERSPRRQARVLAMQALCQWEAQPDDPAGLFSAYLGDLNLPPATADYTRALVNGFWSHAAAVDARIAEASTRWEFSRISAVERNIMRIAVVELDAGEVPSKAAINEAIEIGREFGGEDSPRFINGVLDEIRRRIAGEKPAPADRAPGVDG
ncbi:MAG: transcription antitermination factor NusB [Planctomycetes bacterium]|nr:transcription antitermination factor NusB [Planctomycetota bacterium]